MLLRLAGVCSRRTRLVLCAWLLVVAGGIAAAPAVFGNLSPEVGRVDGTESARAAEALSVAAPSGPDVYAVADGAPAATLRPAVTNVSSRLRALPGVASVVDPWSGQDPRLIAEDGRAVAVVVQLAPRPRPEGTVDDVAALLRGIDARRVVVGGGPLEDDDMDAAAAADLKRAELISMPVVLVLLVLLFGSVLAAGLPVLIALVGVATTMLALLVVGAFTDVSVYAVNVVTMLGLGLAVDYALLIVARFREELALDADVASAVARTVASAGRTVAFSGATVAASLAGLLVFRDDFLRSMGAAGLAVVLLDMLAALTLLPALLARYGHRLGAVKPRRVRRAARPARGLVGSRLLGAGPRLAQRRPLLVVAVTAPVLLLAAAPFLGARFADPDARSLPASSPSRQLQETVDARFPAAADVDPITVVAAAGADLTSYAVRLRALPGVREVRPRQLPGLTVLDVVPEGASQGPVATALVGQVRAVSAPADVAVTGDAAQLVDYQDALLDRLPWALAVVLGATTVLLFAFTGSLLVPFKAVLLTTLSLGASFGALVWVFQDGHLGGLVGTEALGSLSVTTPVLVFAIAFGLSMDYEVFLLGRIAEVHRATGDNTRAVREGLARTQRTITSAALVIVVVFAGFVAGGFSPIKQVGLGLVLAVVVDVTVVRLLLLPALMQLLGERNWWAPAPLRRLHARMGLREGPVASAPDAGQTVGESEHPAGAKEPARV